MYARFALALLTLGLFHTGSAPAGTVDFSYALSVSPQVVSGTEGVRTNAEYSPSGTVSMILGSTTGIVQPGGNYMPGSYTTPSVGGVYWLFTSSPDASSWSQLGYVDTSADVKLTLTDLASGRSGQFDVVARFQGYAGPGDDPFQPTLSNSSLTTPTVQLGDNLYHVVPSSTDIENSALEVSNGLYLQFQVTVTAAQAPEPSSLALAAVAGLGLAVRRRRRGGRAAAAGAGEPPPPP